MRHPVSRLGKGVGGTRITRRGKPERGKKGEDGGHGGRVK